MKIDDDAWYAGLGQVALAFFGGLIGALMRREAASWQAAVLAACGAAFAGFVVAKFCRAMGVSEDLTYAFVGVSGWLGAVRTLGYLERMVEPHLIRLGVLPGRRKQSKQADTNGNQTETDEPGNVGDNPDRKDKHP